MYKKSGIFKIKNYYKKKVNDNLEIKENKFSKIKI